MTIVCKPITGSNALASAAGNGRYSLQNLDPVLHDDVRVQWENVLTVANLAPYIEARAQIALRQQGAPRIRIADMGSGSGQMYLFCLEAAQDCISDPEAVLEYVGLDLEPNMVEQGNENFRSNDNVSFIQGNLANGIDTLRQLPPFDIYTSSFGSPSYLNSNQLRNLIVDIYEHLEQGQESIVILDLLGKYSIEWPCYWDSQADMNPYTMDYLNFDVNNDGYRGHSAHPDMRYWTAAEIESLIQDLRSEKMNIGIVNRFDRSLFVGRHTDTRVYNDGALPLRHSVNSLFSLDADTDLQGALINADFIPEHSVAAPLLNELAVRWNSLIDFVLKRLDSRSYPKENILFWDEFSPNLRSAIGKLEQSLVSGKDKATETEPLLANVFRELEKQVGHNGHGSGHGLLIALKLTR